MKLILFDIDGTLVRGGPARAAFRLAMHATFGTAGAIDTHDFSGKTDPQIARELLLGAGLDAATVDAGFAALWERYLGELEARLPAIPMSVIPGAGELVAALEESGEAALGLVTGNIVRGAKLKLGSVGLDRFPVGGFGSDDEVRNHLPAIAIKRACARWGVEFDSSDVWIVGDTPLDVACGRHEGVRTLAVATGRHGTAELAACGADQVVADLGDLDRALTTLLG
jgi:phosphoglycolate phosphatase-like HAD superfamily hydrolase